MSIFTPKLLIFFCQSIIEPTWDFYILVIFENSKDILFERQNSKLEIFKKTEKTFDFFFLKKREFPKLEAWVMMFLLPGLSAWIWIVFAKEVKGVDTLFKSISSIARAFRLGDERVVWVNHFKYFCFSRNIETSQHAT